MDHLGERLSALVDGELDHTDRDRALRHLASCENCRFEAEMLRRLKRRLHVLDGPEPSTDFMGRLSALDQPASEESPPGPPTGGHRPFGTKPPLGSSRPIGGGLPDTPHGGHLATPEPAPARPRRARDRGRSGHGRLPSLSLLRPSWGRARYAVAGVSVVALVLGTAFVAGEESESAPVVRPTIADYEVEHAVVSGQVPNVGTSVDNEMGAQPTADDPASTGAAAPR